MPDHPPMLSSAPREPAGRPRPIPKPVKTAIALMVRGRDDDPDTKPLGLLEAARAAGISPPILRRYLTRPAVIALLRSERRAFRNQLCCANDRVLADIRDTAANTMSRVAAIRQLEQLEADDQPAAREMPGVTIRIVNQVSTSPVASTASPIIEARPIEPQLEPQFDAKGRRIDKHGEPIFDPYGPL